MRTTLERRQQARTATGPMASSRRPLIRPLLWCGVAYGVAYVIANDAIAATLYDGYSRAAQAISELSASGAPTQLFLAITSPFFWALLIAFGIGVRRAAAGNRWLRMAGALLVAHGAWMPLWLVGPMNQREVIAAGGGTWSDTMHLVLGGLSGLFIVSELAFAAAGSGWWFRVYSILTAAAVVVFTGILTGVASVDLDAGRPTPWLGLVERIGIYGWMLWMAVLAIGLLIEEKRRGYHRAA
jgi:hypothetical protein